MPTSKAVREQEIFDALQLLVSNGYVVAKLPQGWEDKLAIQVALMVPPAAVPPPELPAPRKSETELLTVREFCHEFAVSRSTAFKYIAAGRLRAIKIGSSTRIPLASARQWLAALPKRV